VQSINPAMEWTDEILYRTGTLPHQTGASMTTLIVEGPHLTVVASNDNIRELIPITGDEGTRLLQGGGVTRDQWKILEHRGQFSGEKVIIRVFRHRSGDDIVEHFLVTTRFTKREQTLDH